MYPYLLLNQEGIKSRVFNSVMLILPFNYLILKKIYYFLINQ